MNDLLPLARARPRGQSIHVRYEKAGLILSDSPIPWNADAVIVEALFGWLPVTGRQKSEFSIRVPGLDPVFAESIRKEENNDRCFRLIFRLPVPVVSTRAELLWKHRLLCDIPLPILTPEVFLSGLRVAHSTMTVRIGDRSVSAQTFVANQCRGLTAAMLLQGATSLAPLGDLGLKAVFQTDRWDDEHEVPVTLSSSQLASKEALVMASLSRIPRHSGSCSLTWYAGTKELSSLKVQSVSHARFAQSLRISDTRLLMTSKSGVVRISRNPPCSNRSTGAPGDWTMDEVSRLGPCFFVCSREPGMAGSVTLTLHPQRFDGADVPAIEKTILVTDGPTAFAPEPMSWSELAGVNSFELRYKSRVLGVVSMNPVPTAVYNAEGGFKPPPDFAWSPSADEELTERLLKLMKEENEK